MRAITSDPNLVAYCGLYCGACRAYRTERCPGCHANQKAAWCKIRTCCEQQKLATCADCTGHVDPNTCSKFNNPVAKVFSLLFRSDRAACIRQIRALGVQGHADDMCAHRRQSLRR